MQNQKKMRSPNGQFLSKRDIETIREIEQYDCFGFTKEMLEEEERQLKEYIEQKEQMTIKMMEIYEIKMNMDKIKQNFISNIQQIEKMKEKFIKPTPNKYKVVFSGLNGFQNEKIFKTKERAIKCYKKWENVDHYWYNICIQKVD